MSDNEYAWRDRKVVVSLSDKEKAILESRVVLSGLSRQDYMRKMLLSGISDERQITAIEQSDEIKIILNQLIHVLEQQKQELKNVNYTLSSKIEIISVTIDEIHKLFDYVGGIVNNFRTVGNILKRYKMKMMSVFTIHR